MSECGNRLDGLSAYRPDELAQSLQPSVDSRSLERTSKKHQEDARGREYL